MDPPVCRAGVPPSHPAWEEQRARVKYLYIQQRKTLPETKKFMEDTYGFYADEKQYKTKLKEWNFKKNLSDQDMRTILHKTKKRKILEGKDSVFRFGGDIVDAKKQHRFCKRKNLRDEESMSITPTTPSNISCYTPYRDANDRTTALTCSLITLNLVVNQPSHTVAYSEPPLVEWNGLNMRALRKMHQRARRYVIDKQWNDAELDLRQVLHGYDCLHGPDSEVALGLVIELARTYSKQRRYQDSVLLYERAFAGYQRLHGSNGVKTITSLAAVTLIYSRQGRYATNVILLTRLIEGYEKLYGVAHTSTLATMQELARVYYVLGNADKVRYWLSRSLTSLEEMYGPDDIDCLRIRLFLSNLPPIEPDEGVDNLFSLLVAKFEKEDGRSRGVLLHVLTCLKSRLFYLGDLTNLEFVLTRLLVEIRTTQRSGSEHGVDTIAALLSLARTYAKLRRFSIAQLLLVEVLPKSQEKMGLYHPQTTQIQAQLAFVYFTQSKWNEAELHFLEALTASRKAYEVNYGQIKKIEIYLQQVRIELGSRREEGSARPSEVQDFSFVSDPVTASHELEVCHPFWVTAEQDQTESTWWQDSSVDAFYFLNWSSDPLNDAKSIQSPGIPHMLTTANFDSPDTFFPDTSLPY